MTADSNASVAPPSAKPSTAFLNLPCAAVSSGLDARYSVTGFDNAGTSSTKSDNRASIGSNTAESAIAPAIYGAALPVAFTAFNAGKNPVRNCETPRTSPPVTVLGSVSIVGTSSSPAAIAASPTALAPISLPPAAIVIAPNARGSRSIKSAISATASNAPATACLGASIMPPAISLNKPSGRPLVPGRTNAGLGGALVASAFSAANCSLAN